MSEDEEGFLYPLINHEQCIHCGLCEKACPVNHKKVYREPLAVVAGYIENEVIRLSSASGGAFYALVESCKPDEKVYGAEWAGVCKVQHAAEERNKAYERFRKSKYIQSVIGNSYKEIKEDLESGKEVLFVGTPCQNMGLRSYLEREYNKLLCVDLICHGVSNGTFLHAYLSEMEQHGKTVKQVTFRHKEHKKDGWESKLMLVQFQDGSARTLDYDHCAFLRAYDNGMIFRPSCSSCLFARRERITDMTFGDFWGGTPQSGLDPHHGVSLIMANTEKGQQRLKQMQTLLYAEPVNYDYAVAHNARLRLPDPGNPHRDEFLTYVRTMPFTKAVNRFAPPVPAWKKLAHKLLKG